MDQCIPLRWFSVGTTRSGKSLLGKKLIEEFQKANPTAVTQVIEPYLHGLHQPIRSIPMHLGYDQRAYNEFLKFKLD